MTFLFWLLSRLPLRVLHALGGALGLLAARLPGRYGRRLAENFRHAFPDATDAMLDEAARSTGRLVMEMPYFWSRKTLKATLHGFDETLWPAIERLRAGGKGVIILTPHLGCFEVLPQSHALRHPVTVLFKPPHQPWLRDWIEKMRSRPDIHMAPATPRGVRMLVKALKRGEDLGILPDQVPSGGEGVWAPFFGKPAYTMSLVHRLQQLTGARVVMLFAERLPGGAGYRGHLHVPNGDGSLSSDPVEAATEINRGIEALVTIAPTQYLWGYNRYKGSGGLAASPKPAPADSELST